ncbi:MAG TPA: YeeE/YedE family protein [Polyangiales bacterium]|nr:YeeE/YedE family protein [Polyangiales bacterium]
MRARQWIALAAGLLFGAGLVVSGMTQPVKVLGFLDVTGQFDASLMLVMIGAIAVHFIGYRFAKRRSAPVFDETFHLPTRSQIDAKLIVGALIFGAGWGLGGYCPGPGVVSLVGGGYSALTFVSAMLIGIFATAKLQARTPTNVQSGEAVGGRAGIKVANLSPHEHSTSNQ